MPEVETSTITETTFSQTTSTTEEATTAELSTEEIATTTVKQTTQRHIASTPKTTTTRDVVTDSVEYGMKNFQPTVHKRLRKFAVTAGKIFNYYIPIDAFHDMEDGFDLKLELLDMEGNPIKKSSWCQFNPRNREIYGLYVKYFVLVFLYRLFWFQTIRRGCFKLGVHSESI